MKALVSPYLYELDNGQRILFTHQYKDELIEGTTNEEVLRVLIDRAKALDEKIPCIENKNAINCLEAALSWFTTRTKARQPSTSVAETVNALTGLITP